MNVRFVWHQKYLVAEVKVNVLFDIDVQHHLTLVLIQNRLS